jgi:hypothetical protein
MFSTLQKKNKMNHQAALFLRLTMATITPVNRTHNKPTEHYHMAKRSLHIQLKIKA